MIIVDDGLTSNPSGSEVGFEEITIDLLQTRFWTVRRMLKGFRITSALPNNRELPHSWTQARSSLLILFELPNLFLDE
jgi:hypothetical protein